MISFSLSLQFNVIVLKRAFDGIKIDFPKFAMLYGAQMVCSQHHPTVVILKAGQEKLE